jgi:hypothetical protein
MKNLGFDTATPLTKESIEVMKGKYPDLKFVIRYIGDANNLKNMRAEELKLIINETDWYVIAVYEQNPTHASYFSKKRGYYDGEVAISAAQRIGMIGGAIYATVDYDAKPQHMPAIANYLNGFLLGVGMSSSDHRVGIYGSDFVCGYLKRKFSGNLLTWLSMSNSWRQSERIVSHDLVQSFGNGGALDYDLDQSDGSAGGWRPSRE